MEEKSPKPDDKYTIGDLTFYKSELDVIPMAKLREYVISPGHLFYLSAKFNKPFLLKRAGDILDEEFISKYEDKGQRSFYFLSIVDREKSSSFYNLLRQLSSVENEKDRWEYREKILSLFCDTFWSPLKTVSFLTWITAVQKAFEQREAKALEQINQIDTAHYHKALKASSLAVIFALVCGYVDFKVLNDLFQSVLLMDISLIDTHYDYHTAQALKQLEKRPNDLEKVLPLEVKEKLREHPMLSAQKAANEYFSSFYNSQFTYLIKLHHELKVGAGYPLGINYWGTSEIEAIPALCQRLSNLKEEVYLKEEPNYVREKLLKMEQESTEIGDRVVKRFMKVMREMENMEQDIKDKIA